ncbi:MAG: hypothetical protein M3Q34_00455 [bacterium]|nr:hypothetical protein [bacterium]
MAGLIIGKLTGNYTLSITGALFLDLDHFLTLSKHQLLSKPKDFFHAILSQNDPYGDQRFALHNFFIFLLISLPILFIDFRIGFIFGAAYLSHLILDALDNSDYYPFFPNKKINIIGPIKYFSNQEFVVFSILTFVFFLI